ncbi:class I SAM-dependent methyltransferase [Blastopirellula sp. J2-11]|uniref:class I SAM-dependent methyltransferase n=1 Tax=Blastopirellula sp. J2-11 TaxID=2943192 RepID=UPI0021C7441F|nr:class I SAM-dependent methyltransferase [Blastopirellula sp. J2-11]UUO06596.1 class I SAM-dependent methyltransferase [Blastopirellula sp. J2-11]
MSNDEAPTESSASALDQNRAAWDRKVRQRDRFARPANDEDFRDPLALVDRWGWLGGSVVGQRILCLGAGGGRQGPLYAAAGAVVTIVDISPAQLELDRQVAAERRLALTTVEASMDDLSMLGTADFDVIIHPVSTCYVPDLRPVYAEIARLLGDGGLYISQHKTPTSLQADIRRSPGGYELIEPYYRRGPLPPVVGSRHREEGTLEYLHRWEDLIGLMCRTGFVIEDLIEPLHAKEEAEADSFADRCRYVAPYVRIKARRTGQTSKQESRGSLWLPGN